MCPAGRSQVARIRSSSEMVGSSWMLSASCARRGGGSSSEKLRNGEGED